MRLYFHTPIEWAHPSVCSLRVIKWSGFFGFFWAYILIIRTTVLMEQTGARISMELSLILTNRVLLISCLMVLFLHICNLTIAYEKARRHGN